MSGFLTLNWKDLGKGFLVAFLSSVLAAIYAVVQSGGLPDWKTLLGYLSTGFLAGLAYLLKNLLTNINGDLLKADPK